MDRISCGQNHRTREAQGCRYKMPKTNTHGRPGNKSRVMLPCRLDTDRNGMMRFGIIESTRVSESGIVIVEPLDNVKVSR